jgi:hypothetical protein
VFTVAISLEGTAYLWEAVSEFSPVRMSANLAPVFNPLETVLLDHLFDVLGIVHDLEAVGRC